MTSTPVAAITRRSFVIGATALLPWAARASRAARMTLRVAATPSIFKAMFHRLSAAFQERHPGISIDLTTTARGQDDQLQNTLRQALIGDLPDVSFEGLSALRTLQNRRIAVSLNNFIANDREWHEATYGRSSLEGGSVGETVVGLASAISVPTIYYNADRVAAVLGAQPMPRDWNSILDLAGKLGREAEKRFIGGYCAHATGNWVYSALVQSHGGSMLSPDERRVTFDAPPGKRALDIFHAFGRVGQARTALNLEQARQAFSAGTIGVLVDSSSGLAAFEKQIAGRFKLGTAEFPVAPNGRIPANGIASILMARDPGRQEAGWKFIKFVAGPAGQKIIGESTGYFPANEVVMRRADFLGGYYQARPLVQPIMKSLAFASRWQSFPGNFAPKIDAVIFDEVEAVIGQSKTPAQALAAMKPAVEALLPRRNT